MNALNPCGDCSLEKDWQAGPLAVTMEKIGEATRHYSPEDRARLEAAAQRHASDCMRDVYLEKFVRVGAMNNEFRRQLCCMVNKNHPHHMEKAPLEFGINYGPVAKKPGEEPEQHLEPEEVPGRVALHLIDADGARVPA